MAKFENMTLSYTQIASIPFKTRKSASGSLLDVLSRELTPGQRVALFPSYVNKIYASGGVSDEKIVSPPPEGEGGVAYVPASVEKVGRPKPSKGLATTKEMIPAGLIPGPDGKPMRVPDQRLASPDIKTGDRFQDVIKNYKSRMMKDLGITDFQADGVLGNLAQESDRFRAYNEYGGGPGIGWAQWTTKQRKEAFLTFANENGLDPKSDEASYLYLVHEIKNRPDLLPGGAKTLDKLRETTNAEEAARSFMDNFERPGIPHFDTRLQYTNEISGIPYMEDSLGESERIPNVYDLPETEATAEPIKTVSAVPYDELRTEYPDIIDEDSTMWDRIDPALKAMKDQIIDENGKKVGRETLIAADAAAKVLRQNGLTPRIVSGGDEHSRNHGKGTSVNRSIDIQAYDEDGNKVHLGRIDPQVRKDMLTASQLSVKGENFRIGVPTDGSDTGMHIQSDPDFKPAIWGYSSGEPYTRQTLKESNPEYLQLWEQNQKLDEEERQKTLQSLVGPFEGVPSEKQQTADVSTPTAQPVPMPVLKDTETKAADTSESKVAPKSTLKEMMGGYNAAAGGAEITDPSMIISEDGKKVTRVAETGPEKISVMPRHKSSDVFQENQMIIQERQQEATRDIISKPDIAEQKSTPIQSNFGQQKDYGSSPILVSTNLQRVTPSTGKAFADAKMVSRFNKADIEGDMGIVYIDRGYA